MRKQMMRPWSGVQRSGAVCVEVKLGAFKYRHHGVAEEPWYSTRYAMNT